MGGKHIDPEAARGWEGEKKKFPKTREFKSTSPPLIPLSFEGEGEENYKEGLRPS